MEKEGSDLEYCFRPAFFPSSLHSSSSVLDRYAERAAWRFTGIHFLHPTNQCGLWHVILLLN